MKISLAFIGLLLLLSNNDIFLDDIFVKDVNGNLMNLKETTITKDSVIVVIWGKTCKPCIKKLDKFKEQNRQNTTQIIAITWNKEDNIDGEKKMIKEHEWPFEFYFDNNQNFLSYAISMNYTPKRYYQKNGSRYKTLIPQSYLFVRNKFICFGCLDN